MSPTPLRRDPAGFAVYSGTAAFLDVDLEYPWGTERRPSAVFASEKALADLRGIPLSVEHPRERVVTSRTAKRDIHGTILAANLRTDSGSPAIGIEVIVYSDEALDAIERGDCGLSLGYTPIGDPADPTGVVWNHVSLTRPSEARSRSSTGAAARLDSESTDMMMTIPQLLELLSAEARAEVETILAEMDDGAGDDAEVETADTSAEEIDAAGAMESDMQEIKKLAATVADLAKKVDALTRTDSVADAAGRAAASVQAAMRLGAAMEAAGCRIDSMSPAEQMKAAAAHIAKAAPDLATAANLASGAGSTAVMVDLLTSVKARTDSRVADANGEAIARALFSATDAEAATNPAQDLSKFRI